MSYTIWLEIDTGGPEPAQVTHGGDGFVCIACTEWLVEA
jgi:hypothetical protein